MSFMLNNPGRWITVGPPDAPKFNANRTHNRPCLTWKENTYEQMRLDWNPSMPFGWFPPGYTFENLTLELFHSEQAPFKWPLARECDEPFTQHRVYEIVLLALRDAREWVRRNRPQELEFAHPGSESLRDIYWFAEALWAAMTELKVCREHTPLAWPMVVSMIYREKIIRARVGRSGYTAQQANDFVPLVDHPITWDIFTREANWAQGYCRCIHKGMMDEVN